MPVSFPTPLNSAEGKKIFLNDCIRLELEGQRSQGDRAGRGWVTRGPDAWVSALAGRGSLAARGSMRSAASAMHLQRKRS